MSVNYRELSVNGLWKNNPAIVQLLGLCPLLAVTGTVVNALGLGLATCMVLVTSNTAVSLIRNVTSDAVRLPTFVMIIAAAVTCIELLMQAFSYELYEILGIFLPLITTNCVILGRADGFARKNPVLPAFMTVSSWALDSPSCCCCSVHFGNSLELVRCLPIWTCCLENRHRTGRSCCLRTTNRFFLRYCRPERSFLLDSSSRLKNLIDGQIARRAAARAAPVTAGSKRVRVTGTIS